MIIDKKTWDDMRQSLSTISMPLMAHQQVQSILTSVEQRALQDELDQASKSNGLDTSTTVTGHG